MELAAPPADVGASEVGDVGHERVEQYREVLVPVERDSTRAVAVRRRRGSRPGPRRRTAARGGCFRGRCRARRIPGSGPGSRSARRASPGNRAPPRWKRSAAPRTVCRSNRRRPGRSSGSHPSGGGLRRGSRRRTPPCGVCERSAAARRTRRRSRRVMWGSPFSRNVGEGRVPGHGIQGGFRPRYSSRKAACPCGRDRAEDGPETAEADHRKRRSRAPRRGYGLAEKKRSSTRNPALATSRRPRPTSGPRCGRPAGGRGRPP